MSYGYEKGQYAKPRVFEASSHSNTIDISIIDEPDDLVREELRVVLAVQVRLRGLRGVQLKTLPDAFTEDMARRVCLHNLCHGLLDERLQAGEPVAVGGPQVVGKIHANHDTSRRRIDTHGVRNLIQALTFKLTRRSYSTTYVVKELGTSVPLDVVSVEVAPTELDINPELVAGCAIEDVLTLEENFESHTHCAQRGGNLHQ